MKVQIIRVSDDYVWNVRNIDELLEDGTLASEEEADRAEIEIKKNRRYYLSADTMLVPMDWNK